MGIPRTAITFAAVLMGLAACSDGTGPEGRTTLTLSVATPVAAGAAAGPAAVVSQTDGSNTLELTRVALVLREIELERVETADCERSGEMGDDDGCEEFEIGPLLVELPMDGSVSHVLQADVEAGRYDEVEFEVHKPSDDPADLAFLAAHPDFDGVSIRVEGTFNGTPFVFLQDLDEEQELSLDPPLEVADGGSPTNLTLQVDVRGWFVTAGGELIDPATANHGGANESLVESNVRRSIEVFEDHDEDGERDD